MNKVLIVGINSYPDAPLRGCANDVGDVIDLLPAFDIKPDEIRLVVDRRATTIAILERLNWLVSDLQAGDKVLFWYSGHGAQYPTRDKSGEVDGLLEVICPVDFDWSVDHMITDKQLYEIFSRIPVGVKFNWVSDSCHSGDLTRSFGGNPYAIRRYPMPVDIRVRKAAFDYKKGKQSMVEGSISRAMAALNVGFISGCRSDQTSADAFFNGRPNGALSYYLLQELRKDVKRNINQIVDAVRVELAKAGYDQIPQAEGSRVINPFLN